MTTHALVLGGGGVAGIAWETGLLLGLAERGVDLHNADLFLGTSAGSTVAAQFTSSLSLDELFQRQVDPALQVQELTARPDIQQILTDFNRIQQTGATGAQFLQEIGAIALKTPTVPESARRAVIMERLPNHNWPEANLQIVAINAQTGERVIFTRESGVSLIDAVAASCAVPWVWPPVSIDGQRYIDGGTHSAANLDLAAGFAKVLLIQPDMPPLAPVETLEAQIERLQSKGSQVEVVWPNEAMKAAIAAVGGNALDPSLRETAANIGREQGQREADRVAQFWK